MQPFAQRLAEDQKMQLGKRAKIEVVGATGIVMRPDDARTEEAD